MKTTQRKIKPVLRIQLNPKKFYPEFSSDNLEDLQNISYAVCTNTYCAS